MSEQPDLPPATTELVRRATRGDRAAWDGLYGRHHALMRAIASRRIPPGAEARFDTEDVLQSAFLSAFRQIETFESRGDRSFQRWLTEILVNKLNDKLRHHHRKAAHEVGEHGADGRHDVPSPEDSPSEILVAAESQAEVLAALHALPPEDQEVICLRFLDGLSWSQIAGRLSLSESAARRRGLDAIERLVRSLL